MTTKLLSLSITQICEMIDTLHPCMDDYLFVYDFVDDFYYISPVAVERFALPAYHFHQVEETHRGFVNPDDVDMLSADLVQLKNGEKSFHNLQYRWLSISGDSIWINCRGTVIECQQGHRCLFGCINEIGTVQKADNISGLLGVSSLQSYLTSFNCLHSEGYLLRLGIDDFKEINEKLGSDYGDMLLRHIASCISECLHPEQKVYRLSGDEFLVLDFTGKTREQAITQYKEIRKALDTFVEQNQYEAVFTISGGILPCIDSLHYTFSDKMKLSEFSLNEAKRRGKNCCYCFSQEDYDKFLRRRHLTQLLRSSVNHNCEGFELYLQPLYSSSSKSLYGAESLLRFHTQEYGMVSPVEFIPILEDTGLIIPVGKWVLHRSLEMCSKIQTYFPHFRISINISYIQIIKSDIITDIIQAVSQHQLSPADVIIELTESGRLDSNLRIEKLLSKLREFGIHLALDDFGTGYSNFHYLNELKPDIIKIDRSFTLKALENEYEYNLLSLMSDMVHNLNLKMCIEGIETNLELDRMSQILPDYCQGYFFGRPCSYTDFVNAFILVH